MSESPEISSAHDVECPHCHKPFRAALMSGRAARYEGFKCPHCRLFVPYARTDQAELADRG